MTIVVDAGHGGNDTGAVGPTGLEEASTVLLISQYLAGYLLNLDIEVILTRERDTFVTLGDRCAIANDAKANYFVSVHLNSNSSAAVGIETLYKSEAGKDLAVPVQSALIEATGDVDRGLKHRSDLYVLNATAMPAILVEGGFISHPSTETKLKTSDYQMLLANAVGDGIAAFLHQ